MKFQIPLVLLTISGFFLAMHPAAGKPVKPKHSKSTVHAAGPKNKMVLVHEEADQLQYDDKTKQVHFSGHVKLWQADTYLEADQAVYSMNTQQVEAQGHIFMKNPEGTVTGDHLLLYYDQKHAIVDGNVHLCTIVATPTEENPEKTKKGPLNITSKQLDYDWKNHIMAASGNVLFIQPGRKAYGDHAVYDEPGQHLSMDGHVHLFRKNQDDLLCDRLDYDLKTNHAIAQGHIKGNFMFEEGEAIPSVSKPEVQSSQAKEKPAAPASTPAPSTSAAPPTAAPNKSEQSAGAPSSTGPATTPATSTAPATATSTPPTAETKPATITGTAASGNPASSMPADANSPLNAGKPQDVEPPCPSMPPPPSPSETTPSTNAPETTPASTMPANPTTPSGTAPAPATNTPPSIPPAK